MEHLDKMEIERKFLVDTEKWNMIEKPVPSYIVQAYILNTPEKTFRVRTKGEKGYLTIKGKTIGISRSEFEYEIPLADAQQLIHQFTDKNISKNRFEVKVGDHLWEVDEFMGKLEGLILAEIELKTEDENFELPFWVTEEVSLNPEYYNSRLIERI